MRLIDADKLEPMEVGIDEMSFLAVDYDDINNAPTIEPKQEWIPCSERLPKGKNQVLVNVIARDRTFDIILCFADFVEEYYAKGWINAWMPLPPAWEGADDE